MRFVTRSVSRLQCLFSKSRSVLILMMVLLSPLLLATTIIPFPNLGEMAKASDAVVMARALRNFEVEMNGATRFRTQFQLIDKVSGDVSEYFAVQSLRLKTKDLERRVDGDVSFEEGEIYLLFLHQSSIDYWQTKMLSYAIFIEKEQDNQQLLVPVLEGLNHFQYVRPDGQEVEPLRVFEKNALCSHLKEVVAGGSLWQHELAATDYDGTAFHSIEFRSPPTHCRYLSDPEPPAPRGSPPWPRWQDFENNIVLPVYYHEDGDVGCSSALGKVQGSIANLNANYGGINLSDAGTHSFATSDCAASGGAVGTEFTNWIVTNLGTTRALLVQFNDPCNEIGDLNNCSGVLAFGGTYWFSSTHTHDGIQWNNAAYGFVVTNNDFGTCYCNVGSSYDIVMDHELTHALCAGHIDPLVGNGGGTANMNPSCCNTIQPLDIECLDYTYPLALPVELTHFTAEKESFSVALQWQTASEINNDYFLLERSVAGGTFEVVAKIAGAGNSQTEQNYQYIDREPGAGLNYYRLRQVDFDGGFEYSEVRSVRFEVQGEEISVFPNPLEDTWLNIRFSSPTDREVAMQLIDVNGVVLQQQEKMLEKGIHRLRFSLENYPAGVYWLRFYYGSHVYVKRVVRM